MSELFNLSQDVFITNNLVAAIGKGCPPSPDMPNPIATIEFVIPADTGKRGYWVLGWLPKNCVPLHEVQRVAGVELFLSAETRSILRGSVIDIKKGRIVFSGK